MTSPPESTLAEQLSTVNEYEREPVPANKVKGFDRFVGMVAGEHIAGTEFVIGPLFVLHGTSARDLFIGLLIGNILATLSWTLICAPTAVKTRTTIFYQLERICGFRLVSIYNVVNILLFSASAASMIGVSATAVGLLTGVTMPGLTDLYPTSFVSVLIVLVIGVVIAVVATRGYDQVSDFANIFAPWMPLIFVAGAVAVLPQLGVTSLGNFWEVATTKIWTGEPVAGFTPYTLWHVIAFSWLCNTAMHIGLTDMTIYRYAKKARYGLASAVGMFVGHYMAWIASGILCAIALQTGNANPSPGEIAFYSVGLAGAICVVVAGWTTANPTIYRAGLAFQVLLPQQKRWQLTLGVGLFATLLACSPWLVSRLDQFLGVYALVAAPVGAVVILDVWVFPKIGLKSNYAEATGTRFNMSVFLTWVLALLICYWLYDYTGADFMFFMAIPGWFIGAGLYLVFSKLLQKKTSAAAKPQKA